MNGVHDVGGMDGFGPIAPEADEPVFHATWEARVFAMNIACSAWGKWNIDTSRFTREKMPPLAYLAASYYDRWLYGLETLLVETGMAVRQELVPDRPKQELHACKADAPAAPLTASLVPKMVARGQSARAANAASARFKPGDDVLARVMNPPGHTRIPRYVRGRRGVVVRDHGAFVFPDTNAALAGKKPQHVYGVRFGAREIWGSDAPDSDAIYVDLWDDYLAPIGDCT